MNNNDVLELIRQYESSEIAEDDLTEEQIDEMLAYYKRETLDLESDTFLRLKHTLDMIYEMPIREISQDICSKLDELSEKSYELQESAPKNQAYFLVVSASDHIVSYNEVVLRWSLLELIRYIVEEYSGTEHESVLDFSLNQLIDSQIYENGHKMGCTKTKYNIHLVHDKNLSLLYRYLKNVVVEDGEAHTLDMLFKEAETKEEIEDVIEYYNECQDNIW